MQPIPNRRTRLAYFVLVTTAAWLCGCGSDLPPAGPGRDPFGDSASSSTSDQGRRRRTRRPSAPQLRDVTSTQPKRRPQSNSSKSDADSPTDEPPAVTVVRRDPPSTGSSSSDDAPPFPPIPAPPVPAELLGSRVAGPDTWPQFRGPDGQGTAARDVELPIHWSADENLLWKTELPGPGSSSPIVTGGMVILTWYDGYGVRGERSQTDPRKLRRYVGAFDLASGEKLWEFRTKAPEGKIPKYGGFLARHGYASSTPVTDGEHIYAFFDTNGVYKLTLDGTLVSRFEVGEKVSLWGSGSSPVLFGEAVLVNAAVEAGVLGALHRETGSVLWEVVDVERSWATPVLVRTESGRKEVVLSAKGRIIGVDPVSGTELWSCKGFSDYVCPSVVADGGIVYAAGGRPAEVLAVRTGGSGDVTESHVVWRSRFGGNVASPILDGDYFYCVDENGRLVCLDAASGEMLGRTRLEDCEVFASPILAQGRLYIVTRRNGTFVIEASPDLAVVAQNTLGGDTGPFNASPAVVGNRLLLRSDHALYCIATTAAATTAQTRP